MTSKPHSTQDDAALLEQALRSDGATASYYRQMIGWQEFSDRVNEERAALRRLLEQFEAVREALAGWETRVDDEQQSFSIERGNIRGDNHEMLLDNLTSDQADVLEDWIDSVLVRVSTPAMSLQNDESRPEGRPS